MSASEKDRQQDADTVEHLLGIVVDNREKRCAELRDDARQQAREIIRQAHARSRAHMHRHVQALREKHRIRVASAIARNQTLLRQQHQKADRAILDIAWPLLRDAMQALWNDPDSRRQWLDAAMTKAATLLRARDLSIEHPADLTDPERNRIKQQVNHSKGRDPEFAIRDDLQAGIRIMAQGTVIDVTLDGLLKQKRLIEAMMIARVKQEAGGHE